MQKSDDLIWKFYRQRTNTFFLILIIISSIASAVAMSLSNNLDDGFWKSFINAVILAVLSGTIASAFFTIFTKQFIERDYNELLKADVLKTLENGMDEHSSNAVNALKLKLHHLHKFIPSQPYTNRRQANDIVEEVARKLVRNSNHYWSFGITGKYAALRFRDGVENGNVRPADIKIFMIHPEKISAPLIFDPKKTETELLGSLSFFFELMELEPRLNVELVFIAPLPTLRFDLSEDAALIYLYEDFGQDQAQLPDVALYNKDSHWYDVARSVIREFDHQSITRIRSSDFHAKDDKTAAIASYLNELKIDKAKYEAAITSFNEEFVSTMRDHTRDTP